MQLTRAQIRDITGVVALLGLTGWAFAGCVRNPFHFDDFLFLISPQVMQPGDPLFLIQDTKFRQLAYLSFFLNYRIGGTNPAGYHLFNLLLHLGNVVGMYFFVRLLIHHTVDLPNDRVRRCFPVAAAGLFALHPIQSEVVNYVSQRSTLLAAFFALAALCTFLRSEREEGSRLLSCHAMTAIFYSLAVTGKETALVLPLVLLVYLLVHAKKSVSLRSSFTRAGWLLLTLAILMFIGVGSALFTLYRLGETTVGFGVARISSFRYLSSQIQVVVSYLRLLLWPSGLSVDHDPFIAAWHSPRAWLCAFILLALVVLAISLRRTAPAVCFTLLSFFLFLGPTSSFIPSTDLMFEHRLYIPMIAASVWLAWGIYCLPRLVFRSEKLQWVMWMALTCMILIAYAVISRERTYVWGDNIRLWEDAATKAPRKARPRYNLGVSYLSVNPDKAQKQFMKALELRPGHAPSLYNLGWLKQRKAQYEQARRFYQATLKADPTYWQAHHNLGNLEVLQGKNRDAMREFQEAIRSREDYWPAYLSLGTLQIQEEEYKNARTTLEILKQLRPDLLEARYLLAEAMVEEGLWSQAEEELRALVSRDRENSYKERIDELRKRMASKSNSKGVKN